MTHVVVDPVSRTIKLRAWVNNQDHKLKPEMFARLHIQIGDATRILAVPKEAVVEVDGRQFVYVVEDGNRYMRREVKATNFTSDQMRILEGLVPGQRIVIKGAVLIKGQEVKGG